MLIAYRRSQKTIAIVLTATALCSLSSAAEPAGHPLGIAPPPAYTIGYPSRAADLDALPGFVKPPPGYGEVGFYWWVGDPLTKERLTWQLDQLSGKGVMGLQINYPHSDVGGHSYGLTFPSDPPLFSEDWWKLVQWFAGEAKKRGVAISLSDYTLSSVGQGQWTDEVLKENPDLHASVLTPTSWDVQGGKEFSVEAPEGTITASAWKMENGKAVAGSMVDLRPNLQGRALRWSAPEGTWKVMALRAAVNNNSIDPIDPRTGPKVVEKFFQRFEDRLPGEAGKALNFFFSDELEFGVRYNLWHKRFADEFKKRKGYDVVPELPALFADIGPKTPKVRLDFNDVMVALEEESFFKPVFLWHHNRGMIYGGDHGGRGGDVTEFGDYFRTQRWMNGPGNDQPGLGTDVGRTKVHSSIAHLYQQPRTWLEGYYGSGWGTTPSQLASAGVENYCLGTTLQTFHGLYYTTHGGFWEWAPPCNHFRMPYWKHMGTLMTWTERMCYLLSQGVHRCDVAIIYPVAPAQAGTDGSKAVSSAFAIAKHLYDRGIDCDFIDDQSVERATVEKGELRVSGEAYRVLILPSMATVHYSTLEQAQRLAKAGGMVIATGILPSASDRIGREDAQLDALERETFGISATEVAAGKTIPDATGRRGVLLADGASLRHYDGGFTGSWGWSKERATKVFFKAVWKKDANGDGAGSQMKVNCDNIFTLYINGKQIAQNDNWDQGWTGTIDLADGDVITVDGIDTDNGDHSAGLFVAVVKNGKIALTTTDFRYSTRAPEAKWGTDDAMSGLAKLDFENVHEKHRAAAPAITRIPELIDAGIPRDFVPPRPSAHVLHRVVGPRDVFLVTKLAKGDECFFRATGKVELWDPWTGKTSPILNVTPVEGGSKVKLPKDAANGLLIVFTPGKPEATIAATDIDDIGTVTGTGNSLIVRGFAATAGKKSAQVQQNGAIRTAVGEAPTVPEPIVLDGLWESIIEPTCDNRFGDYRLPAFNGFIGAEARRFRYAEETTPNPGFERPNLDVSKWPQTTYSFGQQFWKLGPIPAGAEADALEAKFAALTQIDPAVPMRVAGKEFKWQPYSFSWREGIEGDPGHQGYHGLKEGMSDEFIGLGRRATVGHPVYKSGYPTYVAEADGDNRYYLWSAIVAPKAGPVRVLSGEAKPRALYLGGTRLAGNAAKADLKAGPTPMLAVYGKPCRTYLVFQSADASIDPGQRTALSMRWYDLPGVLPFDAQPDHANQAGWYRFTSAPGLKTMTVTAHGSIQAWVDGKPCTVDKTGIHRDNALVYRVTVSEPRAEPASVALRLAREPGCQGGGAISEPVAMECGQGILPIGDWSKIDGLSSYSGSIWYRRNVALSKDQIKGRVVLKLGRVAASALVRINGVTAGTLLAPPWEVDITKQVKSGNNRIEIQVCNTLANHYQTIPTNYRGSPESGLLGPVSIEMAIPVVLKVSK